MMPRWSFILTREAEEDLEKLDSPIRKRIIERIKWLRDNFDSITLLPLSGEWRGFFKLRAGDWRIIYDVEKSIDLITIHSIDKRDKIYKRRK